MGQIFASFLQFGQFFQNMSPINAKSLWGGSLMMLLKKTEQTLVEITRKLENPAVKRPYRWRYPLNRNFLTWTMVITISSLDLMPMRCPQVTILWVPTLVTPRITPVIETFPFVPTIHKWFANALLLPMQVTGASHCSSSCTMNTKQIRIVEHIL